MKTRFKPSRPGAQGYVLMLTLVLLSACVLILAGMVGLTASQSRQTQMNNLFNAAVAAASGATEKAMSHMERDYIQQCVNANLSTYYPDVPDQTGWPMGFQFSNGSNVVGQVGVYCLGAYTWTNMTAPFVGLMGLAAPYQVTSTATPTNQLYNVKATVSQAIQMASIPMFQFAIFYNMEMEISPGANMTVNGPVHANGPMYTSPSATLTFNGFVGVSQQIYFTRDPNDPQANGSGAVNFNGGYETQDSVLALPISVSNNNPTNMAASILDPSPTGESPYSAAGMERFANQSALVISNSSAGSTNIMVFFQDTNSANPLTLITNDVTIKTTNGSVVTTNKYYSFVTNVTFYDYREKKTVNAVQLSVKNFNTWLTNKASTGGNSYNSTYNLDTGHSIDSVYIINNQPASSSVLPAVRVADGQTLPAPYGLSVATPQPLYVYKDFNCPTSALGTTNTTGTSPAALIGDAITILSDSWSDSYISSTSLSSRNPSSTTVNAAIFNGIVPTQLYNGTKYFSGGVENFLRLLENWSSSTTLTYNGSMIAMFYSRYGTNFWLTPGNYYNVPTRNWAYDLNFKSQNKLPRLCPQAKTMLRQSWNVAQGN